MTDQMFHRNYLNGRRVFGAVRLLSASREQEWKANLYVA